MRSRMMAKLVGIGACAAALVAVLEAGAKWL
jgi:hypothetical protein